MTRCFDCLAEFTDEMPRFAVLKKMRDVEIPADAMEPRSFFESMSYDAVVVCDDCAGWYGNDALRMAS
jgi:hypothetical protein